MSKIRIESEGTVTRVWVDDAEVKGVTKLVFNHVGYGEPPVLDLQLSGFTKPAAAVDPQVQVVDGVAIDWSKAPDSARYAVRDTDGSWYWYSDTPVAEAGGKFFRSQGGSASLYLSPEMWGLYQLYPAERPGTIEIIE